MTAVLKAITDLIEPQKFDPRKYGRKHTPDILQLQQFKRHLVLLPCDIQKGQRNHHFIKDAEPYGLGYTRRKFVMYTKNLGNESFPIPLPGAGERTMYPKRLQETVHTYTPDSACIRGQLWFVDTETLSEKLDNYRLNGVEFQRELVDVRLTYHEPYWTTDRDTGLKLVMFSNEKVHILKAWLYIGIEKYWYEHLDAGFVFTPTKLYKARKNWLESFYEFR
jgi:hypothetical protein